MSMNNAIKTESEAKFIYLKCEEMINQFRSKNVAYNDSFGKSVQKYGPISALTRMSDKWNRIEALILGADNNIKDERLEDTLVDMACYCLMTLYEIENQSDTNVKVDKTNREPEVLGIFPNCAVDKQNCKTICEYFDDCQLRKQKQETEKVTWKVWGGWSGNHDARIEDATCSKCRYIHPTVYGSLSKLADNCPGCGSNMKSAKDEQIEEITNPNPQKKKLKKKYSASNGLYKKDERIY